MSTISSFDFSLTSNVFDGTQACADKDPEIFFPHPKDLSGVAYAKSICASCPLSNQCLESVLWDTSVEGIWGGTTPRQRQTLRSKLRRAK